MHQTLIDRFLAEEANDPNVRRLLFDALRQLGARIPPLTRTLNFNIYEVTIDVEAGEVLLQDVLDSGPESVAKIALGGFRKALGADE